MIHARRRPFHWRRINASLRDTWLLLREFGWPVFLFLTAIVGGGIFYFFLALAAGEPVDNMPEAVYLVLTLTFLQPAIEFPRAWYLEIFFFIMPVIGLIILAQGVSEFGVMLFNRKERSKEWEMAVASTFHGHHILVGLGHLGYRVVSYLHEMGQDVVVIEFNPSADLVTSVKKMGIPVIQDDAARESALEAAGAMRARSIVLCMQNDSLNLQVALKARRMNQDLRVVVRIFDDDFALSLQDQFGFLAFSATDMAAPVFAAAAAGVDMTRPIIVDGQTLSLAHLKITSGCPLEQMRIGDLEQHYNVSVVLLRRDSESDLHPPAEKRLAGGDALAILGGPVEIGSLVQSNNSSSKK